MHLIQFLHKPGNAGTPCKGRIEEITVKTQYYFILLSRDQREKKVLESFVAQLQPDGDLQRSQDGASLARNRDYNFCFLKQEEKVLSEND